MLIIGIDPGVKYFAFAIFQNARLIDYGTRPADVSIEGKFDKAVVEVPRIYPRGHPRPNNIVDLAYSAGLVLGSINSGCKEIVYPQKWKGQLKKTQTKEIIKRILLNLTDIRDHNIMDAIGIGLYAVHDLPISKIPYTLIKKV